MKLLENFHSPHGTHFVWHSLAAQQKWGPRLNAISTEWNEVERRSVAEGIRPLCLQPIGRGFQYEQMRSWASANGLFIKPIRQVGYFEGFAHRYTEGDDLWVTAIANKPEYLVEPVERYLGYPECCQAFFAAHFPRVLDPVWQWAKGNGFNSTLVRLKQVDPHANPLLRYQSIRFSPHIPCAFDCQASIELGRAMRSCMNAEVAGWVEELLNQTISYNCYRGVAIVTTPLFRIAFGSNATAERYLVTIN